MIRIFKGNLLVLAIMLGLPGSAAARDVNLCVVGDLTGPLAAYGADTYQGAEIAAEEINAAGGIKGDKIALKTFDDKTDPVEAVKIAQQVPDECVAVIVGSGSGPALAAAPFYEREGVPFVATVSSNPKLTASGWNNVARIQLSDYDQSKRMVEYLASKRGPTKLALLHDTSDLGTGGRDAMIKILKDHPEIRLADVEAWRQTDVDFGSQILKAQRSGAQVIYVIGAAEGSARILRQAKSLGVTAQFTSNTSVGNQKFLELAGDSAEGMMITWGAVDPNSPRVQEISRKMKQKYNRDIDIFVAQAYDATNVIADAIKRVGTNELGAAIRAATYNFALGSLSFDKSGHNVRHIFIAKVVSGKFQVID